jgi:hypothetical protein
MSGPRTYTDLVLLFFQLDVVLLEQSSAQAAACCTEYNMSAQSAEQEVHKATTNLAHEFSKLVKKVPASALQAARPPGQPAGASGNAAAKLDRKDNKKPFVGAMDAFLNSSLHAPAVVASSVPTATGSSAIPESIQTQVRKAHRVKACS